MIELDFFHHSTSEEKLIPEHILLQQVDQISGYVENEEIEAAVEAIQPVLKQGNWDIRLIVYYFYLHFLGEGVKSFSQTLPILHSLLDQRWENLKPTQRKERHVENSLNWFFSHILDKLKYMEKQAKERKGCVLWEISLNLSEEDFERVFETVQNFQNFFYDKWGQSSSKEQVTHLMKKVSDLRALAEGEKEEERQNQGEAQLKSISEQKVEDTPCESRQENVLHSEAIQRLMLKLKTFEKLLKKKEHLKAAMVAQDVSKLIENFDPCLYFPKLFTEYFALLAKHASILSEEWQNQGSLEWKYLEKLYQTDIERFVQW